MQNDESRILNIKTFGCFEVTYNGKFVVRRDDRNSKLSQLFSYFVYRRGQMIPQSELIANLLQNDDNAPNILKNLVYRLRKLLAGVGVSDDAILYKVGCYGLSETMPCACDFDEFTALADSLEAKNVPFEQQRDDFLQIIEIYAGDFLQGSCSEAWALSAALRYQQMFEQCVLTVAAAAQHADAYTEILDGLRKASALYVYNENIAAAYITALFETKNSAEALRQYEKLAASLLNDLGVEPCEAVKQVYRRILVGDDSAVESVSALRDAIVEDEAF
ncbi:MAG: BTAD domain-containing putative transcriptional regulator, partial [Oscillospiraceae bacterium]|nr:BTAD domain-containing putative transcriptional regulator [Oscillospiraceae bacterium]